MSFSTEAARWRALTIRDVTANGQFVYTVKSTKIYCRPTCPGRLARRANVGFCKTPAEAQAAGYRACKRCKPETDMNDDPQERAVAKACSLIEEALKEEGNKSLRLQDLAKSVGLTPRYFHKIFKDRMGVTPNEYAKSKMQGQKASDVASDPTSLDPMNLDAFDFNDLLDFDLDPNLPMDNTLMMEDLDQPLPVLFGQEIDPNVQNLAWNGDFRPDALFAGFNGSEKYGELYSTMGWESRAPAVTTFELDATLLLNTNTEFISDFNLDSVADWGY